MRGCNINSRPSFPHHRKSVCSVNCSQALSYRSCLVQSFPKTCPLKSRARTRGENEWPDECELRHNGAPCTNCLACIGCWSAVCSCVWCVCGERSPLIEKQHKVAAAVSDVEADNNSTHFSANDENGLSSAMPGQGLLYSIRAYSPHWLVAIAGRLRL